MTIQTNNLRCCEFTIKIDHGYRIEANAKGYSQQGYSKTTCGLTPTYPVTTSTGYTFYYCADDMLVHEAVERCIAANKQQRGLATE